MRAAQAAWQYYNRPPPPVINVVTRRGRPVTQTSTRPAPVVVEEVVRPPRRRRGGRGRGRPMQRAQAVQRPRGGGSHVIFQDTEVLGTPTKTGLYTLEFNPGSCKNTPSGANTLEATRLNYEAAKYNRFRIRYVNIAYKGTTSTYTTGQATLGIMAGPSDSSVKTASDIQKLRPLWVGPVWKNGSISVGQDIQSQLSYLTSKAGDFDGVPFTIYFQQSNDSACGVLEISYLVEFSFPKP